MKHLTCIIYGVLASFCATGASVAAGKIDFAHEISTDSNAAPERLHRPRALAVATDRIYICDTDAHRIAVMGLDGRILHSWGVRGSKAGQFRSPAGIALDETGRVYVADTGNNRIQVFDGAGRWVRAIGSRGSRAREFSAPAGIDVRRGFLYVADAGNRRVQVLTLDGIFISELTGKGAEEEMRSPVGVAVDARNRVHVLDTAVNKVFILELSGALVRVFGGEGEGPASFERPQGIVVDDRGSIYIADTGNNVVKKFDSRGALLGATEPAGPDGMIMSEVTGLAVGRDGGVWALDAGRGSVRVFSSVPDDRPAPAAAPALPAVAFLRELPGEAVSLAVNGWLWGLSGDTLRGFGDAGAGPAIGSRGSKPASMRSPRGLAVDGLGNFWVADTGNDRLQKFSADGSLLHVIGKQGSGEGEFRSPSGIAVSSRGNLYVADTGNQRVQILSDKGVFISLFGKAGDLAGQFAEIVDIAVDPLEHIYVVDRGNNRVAKYDAAGKLIWEQGGFLEPENIALSGDNEVFVLDAGNARVRILDTRGQFLRQFGSEGMDPGQFRYPQGLALENGIHLYVGDRGNRRVQAFHLKQTPNLPRSVTAQPKINEIQVSWKPGTESYLEHYRVYRADSPADEFRFIGTTEAPFYIDRNLPSNRAYHYRVSSQAREGNESALSDFASAVTPKLIPTAPGKVRAESGIDWIALSWLPGREPFIDHYRVYRTRKVTEGFELLTTTEGSRFADSTPARETIYYYQVTAVGRDGDESPPSEVVFASIPPLAPPVPAIELSRFDAGPLFASSLASYEVHPVARAVISNGTGTDQYEVKVSFNVRDLMDSPTVTTIPLIGPNQQVALPLFARFNEKMTEASENRSVRMDVSLSYDQDGEQKTRQKSLWLPLYNRHALQRGERTNLGAFVTSEDPVVADFSKFVVQQYKDDHRGLPQPIVFARALYDALGLSGVSYQVDQTSPYGQFAAAPGIVDYIQYPRETLARKCGDCDDLSLLFAAALENAGVRTTMVMVPGRMFMMFHTGIAAKDRVTVGFPDELVVLYDDAVWVPVEMTVVGTSFTRAWQEGARLYRGWAAKGQVDILPVRKAWEEYRPIALPAADANIKIKKQAIEAAFRDELETLSRRRLLHLSSFYRGTLRTKPDDAATLARLGILYSENNLLSEALEQFQKLLALDKNNAYAYTNIGNISFQQGRFDDARQAYEAARALSPGDPGIMINIVRVLAQTGRADEAKKLFLEAAALDPGITKQYGELAAKVGVK